MEPGLPFFEKESKQRNFVRNFVSPLCFKGQVKNLSLFVFSEPSPWGPTPLVKGPIPPVRGKWPKAKRGRDVVPKGQRG